MRVDTEHARVKQLESELKQAIHLTIIRYLSDADLTQAINERTTQVEAIEGQVPVRHPCDIDLTCI